jgi:hypothetical protein
MRQFLVPMSNIRFSYLFTVAAGCDGCALEGSSHFCLICLYGSFETAQRDSLDRV